MDATLLRALRRVLGPPGYGHHPWRILTVGPVDARAPTMELEIAGPLYGEDPARFDAFAYARVTHPTAPLAHLHGYRVELFGAGALPGTNNSRVYQIDLGPPINRTIHVEAWRQRAYIGEELYAELRWQPGVGTTVPGRASPVAYELARIGWPVDAPPKSLRQAQRAITLLRRIPRNWSGGRPLKGKDWTDRQIVEWYEEARDDYANDGGEITLRDFADAIGVRSLEIARTRLRNVGLTWPPS